jgi:GrpB-like predicted nucleotidyltransferase (UPF0157 family)
MAFNSTLQTMEDPILVVDYDADWPLRYEQEKIHILDALGNTIADIQHIGSTSVPGLAAKPVIDILLGVEHVPPQTAQIAGLGTLGYLYFGELGFQGGTTFAENARTHQIHLVKLNSEFGETRPLSGLPPDAPKCRTAI